ncbi:MAG: autotransporter domain-containing protein [Pasteurellaceae bacterium]|nr:autotransporter domain-containing protein [Pasteurellaceae bacterium]
MKKTAIAVALSTISTLSFAQNIVVFGDSLSDIGQQNWAHKSSYYQNGVANPLYNEILATEFGGKIRASSQGGTNYAYSAGVSVPRNSDKAALQPNVVVQKQIETYLAVGAKPSDLHIVWSGGNDMAAILQRAVTTGNAVSEVLEGATEFATANAKQWATLRHAGVDTAIFPTVPNVVYTPSLFQQFGKSAAQGFKKQAMQFVPEAQAEIVANAFENAFNAHSQALNVAKQSSFEDFEQARLAVLKNTVSALYQSPLGAALSAKLDQQTATQMLIQQYQQTAGQAAKATALLNEFTTKALNNVGGNVVRLDVDSLFKDMLSRPQAYGLTNTVGVACDTTTQAQCRPANPTADTMLFADNFHPNLIAHQVMADYITTTLNSPKEMAVLARLAERNSEMVLDVARNESNANRLHRQAEKTVAAVAHYQQQNGGNGIHLGLKAQFSPEWQFSVLASQQTQKAHLGATQADSKTKAVNATLRRDAENWWLGSAVQIAATDYQTQRSVKLGSATHRQNGEASGATLSTSLFAGYEWKADKNVVSALGDLTYSHAKIAPFGETQAGATRLDFAQQLNRQLKTGLGVAYRFQGEQFQPFVSARWIKNWLTPNQILRVGLNGGQFEVKLPTADRNWVNLQAGVNYQFAKIPFKLTAYVSQDVARKQAIAGTTFNAGLSYQF